MKKTSSILYSLVGKSTICETMFLYIATKSIKILHKKEVKVLDDR